MTRSTFTIAIAVLCSGAAAPVTFESACECGDDHGEHGRFNFSPPGEGVEVSFGEDGFTAEIGGEFVDHWRKIR